MNTPVLTLYFDGNCAFCNAEMSRLRRWDRAGRLCFIDIAQAGFDPAPLGVDMAALNRELHSKTEKGVVLVGIDSMLAAYTLVGKRWRVFPLRIRVLRPLLSGLYRKFARNRYRFSKLMGYKSMPQCDEGVCNRIHPFLDR
jgi:predicted DCC family thiol-disulfide oxidoreductase YuxK